MKRLIAAFFFIGFAVLLPVCSFCQDAGFIIENSTAMNATDNFLLSQTNKADLWFAAKNDTMEFKAQGSYWISLASLYFLDLDYCFYSGRFQPGGEGSALYSVKVGRFLYSDQSRFVLDAPLDGMLVSMGSSSFTVSLYAGYSGLIWNPQTSTVDMTLADNADKSLANGFFLGPPRAIEAVSLTIPQIIPFHTLTVSLIGQEDLRNSSGLIKEGQSVFAPSKGGALHSFYAGLGLDGSFSSIAYYNLFGYFETGTTLSYLSTYQYKPIIAGLLGGSVLFYFENILFSRIELKGVYSTGDPDYTSFKEGNTSDTASLFIPISNELIGVAFTPELGNLFFFSATYSFKPFASAKGSTLDNLQALVRGLAFFRSGMGPVSSVAINSSSSSLYLGTEADLIFNYRPTSDLGISLSAGVFFPDKGSSTSAIVDDGKPYQLSGKLELSMAL
jgi:hypothetical protein